MLQKQVFLMGICGAAAASLLLLTGCGEQKIKPIKKTDKTIKVVKSGKIKTTDAAINPSFEEAKVFDSGLYEKGKIPVKRPVGWTTKNQILNDSDGWVSDEAHKGKRSLKIQNIGGTNAYWEGEPIILTQDANAFEVSIWTKTGENAANIKKGKFQISFAVYFKDASGREVWGRKIFVDIHKTGKSWEKTSKRILIVENISRIVPYLCFSGTKGTVWFDDLSIIPYLDRGKVLFDSNADKALAGKVKIISDKNKEKTYKVTGSQQIMSTAFIPVEADKTYRLSSMFKSTDKAKSLIYFGFVPYDKNKTFIDNYSVKYRKNTETELAKKCSLNDKVIFIKDAAYWEKSLYGCIAFNVDTSGKYSDLPNFNYSSVGIKKISFDSNNGYWKIELAKACRRAYPAGTKIREHISDGSGPYIYSAAKNVKVPFKWFKCKGVINKENRHLLKRFRSGTEYVKIVILGNYNQPENELLIKDIKLKEFD